MRSIQTGVGRVKRLSNEAAGFLLQILNCRVSHSTSELLVVIELELAELAEQSIYYD